MFAHREVPASVPLLLAFSSRGDVQRPFCLPLLRTATRGVGEMCRVMVFRGVITRNRALLTEFFRLGDSKTGPAVPNGLFAPRPLARKGNPTGDPVCTSRRCAAPACFSVRLFRRMMTCPRPFRSLFSPHGDATGGGKITPNGVSFGNRNVLRVGNRTRGRCAGGVISSARRHGRCGKCAA